MIFPSFLRGSQGIGARGVGNLGFGAFFRVFAGESQGIGARTSWESFLSGFRGISLLRQGIGPRIGGNQGIRWRKGEKRVFFGEKGTVFGCF